MSTKIITMNRGDTTRFTVAITDLLCNEYQLTDEDILYFGLMDPHQPFENALIKKRFTKEDLDEAGHIQIELLPEDTLEFCPGIYYYAIKLHHLSLKQNIDEVITVVNKTKFVIND